MIKLLIVDDEQEIREGIKYSVDWAEHDIMVIGEAGTGSEALAIIDKTFPDIILVDIRMPEMNGLQLMEALVRTHPYIKSIILSGYEDFEYARKGLQFGASDYLLKPCRPNDILSSVLKVKDNIQNENIKNASLQKYQREYNEFLPLVKNKYLNTLLTENITDESILQKINFLQFDISLNNIKVLVIRLDSFSDISQNLNTQDTEQMQSTIISISKGIISANYSCEIFEAIDDTVILINIDKNEEISLMVLDSIKSTINENLALTVSIGVSSFCETIDTLSRAYKEALYAVDYKFFFGENSTIIYNDIKNLFHHNKSYPVALERQLINCIKAGQAEVISTKLNIFIDALTQVEKNKSFIIKSSHALLFSLYHLCIENNVTGDEILEYIADSDNLCNFSTIAHLKQDIYEIIIASSKRINNNKINNKLVESTIKYINENYNKNINLETVAKNTYITPSYVSLLFKQVLGINFVDYLHKIRLNKACELLRDPKLKSYEIAYMVGYNDDKYFSQIFKKNLGLTPTQYRENII